MESLVAFVNRLLTTWAAQIILAVAAAPNKLLCARIMWMARRDQRSRHALAKDVRGNGRGLAPAIANAPYARMKGIDQQNTQRMKSIVDQYGWPGASLVGPMGAQFAWLIVQHAVHDHEFQERCLGLLEQAVGSGDAQPAHLAYLIDRVRLSTGLPQLYGTQFDEAMNLLPIENLAEVDQRRKVVGLQPLKDYLAQVHEFSKGERSTARTAIRRPPAG